MRFPPTHNKTLLVEAHIFELEALKKAFSYLRVAPKTVLYLRRVSILKSALYSARIEGSPLQLEDVSHENLATAKTKRKLEVANIARGFSFLDKQSGQPFTIGFLKELHGVILSSLSGQAGRLRQEESAIFNQAGVAVYLAPAPQQIIPLIEKLLAYCHGGIDHPAVCAAVSHIWFEKIHPFLDGNGRVGRLLAQAILRKDGYDLGGIVPLEEYLDEHRDAYYSALSRDTGDVTEFVEFFLGALVHQAKKTLEQATAPIASYRAELLPRRAEILDIIGDHKTMSFDGIARRFRAVSAGTIHYDLAYLVKHGYIKKLGSTRGAVYVPAGE